jgi:hypothetical protein
MLCGECVAQFSPWFTDTAIVTFSLFRLFYFVTILNPISVVTYHVQMWMELKACKRLFFSPICPAILQYVLSFVETTLGTSPHAVKVKVWNSHKL